MTLVTRSRARAAFTLVELLVVISIIAILLALGGAALIKTSERQSFARSGEQVFRCQKSIAAEMEKVNSQARNGTIDPWVVAYCEDNQDRARSVWTAMTQRREFPETFAEALTPSYITQDSGGVLHLRVGSYPGGETPVFAMKPHTVFQSAQTGVTGVTAPGNANEQSGILLYIALTQKSVTGGGAMGNAGDDLTNSMRVSIPVGNGQSREAFADGFKNAVGFKRWDFQNEAQSSDYVDPKAAFKDPLDPKNAVNGWANGTKRTETQALGFCSGLNRVTSVYSLGKDKADPKDDVLGFRVLKQGNKGY